MIKAVVFDVWGDYAHFRIPYTTSSRDTYPIPPKTTIVGMVASILGYKQYDYLKWFENNKPLVSLFYNKVSFSTMKMGIKLETKKGTKYGSSPTSFFFVRKPYYTIFFTLENDTDGVMKKLKNYLQAHKSVYHFFLGTSNCLANFQYLKTVNVKKCTHAGIIYSPIPVFLGNLQKENSVNTGYFNKEYTMYKMPMGFDADKMPYKFQDFILEKTDNALLFLPDKNKNKTIYKVEYEGKAAVLY